MTDRPAAVVAALVVLAGVAAAMPAAGVAAQEGTPTATNGSGEEFGSAISSFMQASAADAEGDVDNGMWAAGFDRADEQARAAMVDARAETLERRLERLERRRDALLNDSEEEVTIAERARAARLAARAAALGEAADQTEAAAASVGVDVSRLRALRQEARNLTGPAVAALARNVTGTPPGGPPSGAADRGVTGPPGDGGNPPQEDPGQSNRSNGSASGDDPGGGPPDDAPANDG